MVSARGIDPHQPLHLLGLIRIYASCSWVLFSFSPIRKGLTLENLLIGIRLITNQPRQDVNSSLTKLEDTHKTSQVARHGTLNWQNSQYKRFHLPTAKQLHALLLAKQVKHGKFHFPHPPGVKTQKMPTAPGVMTHDTQSYQLHG